jgi:hypothetical protein
MVRFLLKVLVIRGRRLGWTSLGVTVVIHREEL